MTTWVQRKPGSVWFCKVHKSLTLEVYFTHAGCVITVFGIQLGVYPKAIEQAKAIAEKEARVILKEMEESLNSIEDADGV